MKSILIVSLLLLSFSATAREGFGNSKIQMSETYARSGDRIAKWETKFLGHSRIEKVQLLPSEISQYRQVNSSELLRNLREPANGRFR